MEKHLRELALRQSKSSSTNRVVHSTFPHKLNQVLIEEGTSMEKYDKTLKIGKTLVHIVAPPPMSKEELERVLADYHSAGWVIIEEMSKKSIKPKG